MFCFPDSINTLNSVLDVRRLSEQFSSDGISVVFKWNVSNILIYYQQLLQNVSINVVPGLVPITETGTFQLMLLYNTLYNVSITQPGICGQPNQTILIKLSYSKYLLIGKIMLIKLIFCRTMLPCSVGECDDPSELIHSDVVVMGYEDPALEGENITFTCPSGAILSGSNSSICMENGEWEPDSSEVECTRELVTTGTTMPSMPQNSLHTMHMHA